MWLPFLAFTVYAAWRFWMTAFRLKSDGLDSVIDGVAIVTRRFFRRIAVRVLHGDPA
jgi:hypothetical protein